MKCAAFKVQLEEWLERGGAAALPGALRAHADGCARCRQGVEAALRSRVLLRALGRGVATEPSPYFAECVRARIQAAKRVQAWGQAWGWMSGLRVAGRDLVLATALFGLMLGSFIYNFQRTERPNSDEAMALDVPHTNPMHPADDHVRPRAADAMLSLMNP